MILRNTYFISAFLTFALLSALTITASYLLDPFSIYRWTEQAQGEEGVELFWYLRLHKPYRMESLAPRHLVLGSSRAARLPPAAMTEHPGAAYNASMPGATLYELQRMLEHGQAIRPLKSVVLGLDYSMFRPQAEQFLEFCDDRLRRVAATRLDSIWHLQQRLIDRWNTLFSRGALAADINAGSGLRQSKRSYYPDGTWTSDFPLKKKPFAYAMLSEQKFSEFFRQQVEPDFSPLEQIMLFTADHDISLTLLISPNHGHQMTVIQRAGAWPSYLDYQRKIVEIAQRHAATGSDVRVFGLEHQQDLVHEAPDAARDWFRDGIHFSLDTGRAIMACLFIESGQNCDRSRSPLRLTPGNIDDYLTEVSANLGNYPRAQPKWSARLEQQLNKLAIKQ